MQNVLETAMRLHQSGDLGQAAGLYRDILAQQPENADALHLLGVIEHQSGNSASGADLIKKAIAIQPANPAYHSNLADVQRELKQYAEAIASCRAALELKPDFPDALNNLGLTVFLQGKAAEAIPHFREAIRLNSAFAMAHNNLGNALRETGDDVGAIDSFRRALELNSALTDAHSNLGQMLLERNELEEALAHSQEAVRLRPDFAEAHNNLGNALRELGRLGEAKNCYVHALRLKPGLALAHNNVGQTLHEEGKFADAMAAYKRGLDCDPNCARIHCNAGALLEELEQYSEAIQRYETALRINPVCAEAHCGLGSLCKELGQHDAAAAYVRKAIGIRPTLAVAHAALGALLTEQGDFAEAEASLREALRHDHTHVNAYAQLASLQRGKLSDHDLSEMLRLLARPYLSESKRTTLHFAIGQVLDGRGEYAKAAEHLIKANGLAKAYAEGRGRGYDAAAHEAQISQLIATFTPELLDRMRGWGSDSVRPVFIVGLPRSGTTLTEQILASHSQVYGAGELRCMRQAFESVPQIARLDRSAAQQLAESYLFQIAKLNAVAPRIVDKMPDNYLYLGLITILFPQARIIHCRRDLRDTAVSCWSTQFRQIRWANDSAHIASRFKAYLRLMEHWRKVLPASMLEIDYEETVGDLETSARRLVAYAGLEWEPACLNFHSTRRPVKTASVAQVRQPVYQHSVDRWKCYESALRSLFQALQE